MSALARWCARRRFIVLAIWLAALIGVGGAVGAVGSSFSDSVDLPSSESSTAYELLGGAGLNADDGAEAGNVVWQTDDVPITDPAVVDQVEQVLAQIAAVPGVQQVLSPYDAAGAEQLNAGAGVAYASVTVTGDADVDRITALVDSLDGPSLQALMGGSAFDAGFSAGGSAELIGVLCALVILLLVFRSVWAAVLPIITGVAGVGVSAVLVLLVSNVITLPSQTTAMGSLIGLGVGIDYALFIVNRHRRGLMRGMTLQESIAKAVNTSGRAVVFAGGTVVIALLGMIILQVGILTGMAMGAAVTVLLTVLAALTLLPALLAMLGTRVLSRRQRRELAAGTLAGESDGVWGRWATTVQRRPGLLGLIAAVLVIALAIPVLSTRLGSADNSSDPSDSGTYQYTAMMAAGFGDGFAAQLLLVGQLPDDASRAAFTSLADQLGSVSDVTAVDATPVTPGQPLGVITGIHPL